MSDRLYTIQLLPSNKDVATSEQPTQLRLPYVRIVPSMQSRDFRDFIFASVREFAKFSEITSRENLYAYGSMIRRSNVMQGQ